MAERDDNKVVSLWAARERHKRLRSVWHGVVTGGIVREDNSAVLYIDCGHGMQVDEFYLPASVRAVSAFRAGLPSEPVAVEFTLSDPLGRTPADANACLEFGWNRPGMVMTTLKTVAGKPDGQKP